MMLEIDIGYECVKSNTADLHSIGGERAEAAELARLNSRVNDHHPRILLTEIAS